MSFLVLRNSAIARRSLATSLDVCKKMADQKDQSSSPPLLLFPPSEGLAPQLVPVPATASLFPAEDGEADSFLGQNDPLPLVEQQQQQSPYPFFQQQPTPPQPDPFANLSQQQSPPLQPQQPVSQPLAPPTSQSYYVQQQLVEPPPVNQPPPPPSYEQAKYAAIPPQRSPMAYPQHTSPQGPPTSGFVPRRQFDPNKPPPQAEELEHMHSASHSVLNPQAMYNPVQAHWFYCKEIEHRSVWKPFSMTDSLKLEESLTTVQQDPQEYIVQTDGGRYDVNVTSRIRNAVYWEEKPTEVRRCTWFYKGDGDNKFTPYQEKFAEKLEEEYKVAVTNNIWHRRLEFPDGETVVMHNPNVIVHFRPTSHPDEWGTAVADSNVRPRVVKRGMDEDIAEVEEGEPAQVDHVLFVVHGIGPVCDLRFRSIVECVDDFRSVSLGLLQSHFRKHQEDGRIGRIEFIPVSWHDVLHGDATGVDRQLRKITLPSIGRLRHFTNDTLLDILFYSSPTYCQTVCDQVAGEINRLHSLFLQRNPSFSGRASLIGHSLGSLVCFDLLSHQKDPNAVIQPPEEEGDTTPGASPPRQQTASQSSSRGVAELDLDTSLDGSSTSGDAPLPSLEESLAQLGLSGFLEIFHKEQVDMESLVMCGESDLKEMGLPLGPRKKLAGFVRELSQKQEEKKREAIERKKLEAELRAKRKQEEEALRQQQQYLRAEESDRNLQGSAMSVHVDYTPGVSGIGQPFVEYPQFSFKPACFFGLGSPVALFLTVRGVDSVGMNFKLPTCDGYFNIFHPFDPVAYRIEPIINPDTLHLKPVLMPHHKGRKRLHLELRDSLTTFGADLKRSLVDSMKKTWKTIHQFAMSHTAGEQAEPTDEEMEKIAEQLTRDDSKSSQVETASIASSDDFEIVGDEFKLGALNKGNRIDYVLQEKPIESFNEYLFALGSHACYWESEDTVLMILKEIYALQGILPQKQGPDKRHQPPPPPQHRTLLPSP